MKVIILAGGRGTRLPHSAKNIPKALVRIGAKTLLDYQIEFLEYQGFTDIRLSLGYLAEKIIKYLKQKYPKKCEWVIEKEPLGTGGALKYASQDLKKDFLVFNIDDFPRIDLRDFVNFHQNHSIENTLAIYRVPDARGFGLVKHNEGLIQEFLEKPKLKKSGFINTGFYILNPKIFQGLSQKKFSIEKDIFPLLAQKQKLAAYDKIPHWFTVGTEERLREAKRNFKKYFLLRHNFRLSL